MSSGLDNTMNQSANDWHAKPFLSRMIDLILTIVKPIKGTQQAKIGSKN
jgi:hypothetical protein